MLYHTYIHTYIYIHIYTCIHHIHNIPYTYVYNASENVQETRLAVAFLSRTTIVARRAQAPPRARAPNPRDSPVMSDPDVLGRVDRMYYTRISYLYICSSVHERWWRGKVGGLRVSVYLYMHTHDRYRWGGAACRIGSPSSWE